MREMRVDRTDVYVEFIGKFRRRRVTFAKSVGNPFSGRLGVEFVLPHSSSKSRATLFMQYLLPVGSGPSSNT